MTPKVIFAKDKIEAQKIAKELLYKFSNPKTVLFLSGGSTPLGLYESLAKEKILKLGACAIIDERYGEKFHTGSNEKMIKDAGLLSFAEKKGRFYAILENNKDINETSKDYDET